jgi:hypothetical protein
VPWIVPAAVMRAPMTSATTPPIRMVRTAVQSWKSLASHVINTTTALFCKSQNEAASASFRAKTTASFPA